MKTIFALAVISIFLISACVNSTDVSKAGISFIEKKTDDMLVHAELSQASLRSGFSTNLKFTVENKQQTDLRNIRINVYDLCDFTCAGPTDFLEAKIRANMTKDFFMNCKAPEVESERTCEIKFQTLYDSSAAVASDVYTITQSEFAAGKTQVSPQTTSTKSPLKISASWSDSQPFVDGDEAILYLDYSYTGDGIIEKLQAKSESSGGNITFSYPRNLEMKDGKCIDFVSAGTNTLTLGRDLTFIDGKAKRSTCVFASHAIQPIESGKILINSNFTYKLDGSIPVTVTPKKNI